MHKIIAVMDAKADCFDFPFFQQSIAEAERSFKQIVNDPKSKFWAFPEDFDLYLLGEYDKNTGTVVPLKTPTHLVKAINLIDRKKKESIEQMMLQKETNVSELHAQN